MAVCTNRLKTVVCLFLCMHVFFPTCSMMEKGTPLSKLGQGFQVVSAGFLWQVVTYRLYLRLTASTFYVRKLPRWPWLRQICLFWERLRDSLWIWWGSLAILSGCFGHMGPVVLAIDAPLGGPVARLTGLFGGCFWRCGLVDVDQELSLLEWSICSLLLMHLRWTSALPTCAKHGLFFFSVTF